MWNRIAVLIWKELLSILRDAKSRMAILTPPTLELVIFTFAATLDVNNVPIGILNQDFGGQSIELIQRFRGSSVFKQIVFLQGSEEIAPFIDNQKGLMVVSFNESFSRDLLNNTQANIQLVLDGRRSNAAQIVSGYVSSIVEQYNAELSAKVGVQQQNAKLFSRNWFNPNLLYYWYNIPSLMALLSLLTCMVVTTQSVARERELGTLDQLLVSPLLPIEILIGKIVPGILVGITETTLLIIFGVYVFGVPFTGSILLLYLAMIVFVTAVSGIGLFISSFSQTQQQAMLGTFFFMTPSMILSGFATPIENMPTWLQPVAYLNPLTYMLIISKGIFLKAMPASIVFANIWPMVLLGCFTILGAGWFFRRRIS